MSGVEKNRRMRFSEDDRKLRLNRLRDKTGLRLPTYGASQIDPRSVSGNVENFIGTISFPVGMAGPLNIRFKNSEEELYAPITTTEGALISSIQRGALALNLSGGVNARCLGNKMIRAPQFEFETLDGAIDFVQWLKSQFPALQGLVQNKSQHAKLLSVEPYNMGRTVHVRFVFSTGNAAGQNMTTFCTSYLCQWLLSQWSKESSTPCVDFMIEGNLSSDKKTSALSASQGRGRMVIAEATIKASVLKRVMKGEVADFVQRFSRSKSARILTGFSGYNINVSNVVAGFFLSTGQDAACIHESSLAELHMEQKGQDLYLSLYMPCLVVGTVGGGTHLPSFRDNLEILGCHEGPDSADRLAQIIASYALALELSTLSAVGGGQFVGAHEQLARQSNIQGFKRGELNEDFFRKSLDNHRILDVHAIPAENKQGFLTDIALQVSKKMTGIFAYEILAENEDKNLITSKAFLKIKPHARELTLGSAKVIETLSPGLADLIVKRSEFLPYKDSHIREIELLSNRSPILSEISPRFLGSFIDQEREAFILIQEMIEENYHVSEIENLELWTRDRKARFLKAITKLHLNYLNKKDQAFAKYPSLMETVHLQKIEEQVDLWDSLYAISYAKIQRHYPTLLKAYDQSLENYEEILKKMGELPSSIIHYDFNPRNMAFHPETGSALIFDWEFAAWGLPQRDLVEFILFTSNVDNVICELEHFSEFHRGLLGESIGREDWETGLKVSFQEFVLRRLPFYFVLSELSFCPYMSRLLSNLEVLSKHWGWSC